MSAAAAVCLQRTGVRPSAIRRLGTARASLAAFFRTEKVGTRAGVGADGVSPVGVKTVGPLRIGAGSNVRTRALSDPDIWPWAGAWSRGEAAMVAAGALAVPSVGGAAEGGGPGCVW